MRGDVRTPRRLLLTAAITLAGLSVPASAAAQYFGQNKVEYKHFDYQVTKTAHFDIYYYPEERSAVAQAAQMAERWYTRHSKVFDHQLSGRQPLILYAAQPDFEQTTALPGAIGEGTGGVTDILRRRIILPFAGPLRETDHVIGHELVHAFQFDITSRGNVAVSGTPPAAAEMPLWFVEGMAEYLSLGPVDPNTAMWLRSATLSHKLPTIGQLENPKYFPYRYGQAFWAYIGGTRGDSVIGAILKATAQTGDWRSGIEQVLGIKVDQLSRDWHAALEALYDPVAQYAKDPTAYGTPVVSRKIGGGDLNLAPALSPDGSRLVFFSEKNRLSIELYLADAHTGKILRRLTKSALDPHLSSIEFIASAGAWNDAGDRFVYAEVRNGRPALTVLAMPAGKEVRKIKLENLDEIANPTWAPDGHRIAFSASQGGYDDLFIYDLQTGKLDRLTNDAYGEVQPAWSPDGSSIAFVTDRFTTNLDDLNYGRYAIGLIEPATGRIRRLKLFTDGNETNPQWAPDGKVLYFVSDRDGISNVYRVDIGDGQLRQLTNLTSGVSGITALSPALSSARHAQRIAFSAFEQGGDYSIYTIDSQVGLAGEAVNNQLLGLWAGVLPPGNRTGEEVVTLEAEPDSGLPAASPPSEKRYHPTLALDYLAQPSIVAGVGQFGTYLGGGTALYWSDLLGTQSLVTLAQINGRPEDFTALVGYSNQAHRWNWGAEVYQIPYVTAAFGTAVGQIDGVPVQENQTIRLTQFNREVGALVAYPFNRAQRVEFSAGVANIAFSARRETDVFSLDTGQRLVHQTENLPSPSALNLGQASAALVYDNALFGATGPVLGQRYRLEASPTFGSLHFTTALGDYRRYFMPLRPFTIAVRVLHYGRYGSDAEDPRLSPLFLGYPDLIRGYNISSFRVDECHPDASSSCPVFDRLLGSRMLTSNFEVRYPLSRALGARQGILAAVPVDLAAFADAGLAWESNIPSTPTDERAFFLGGDRRPVYSAGLAARINLLGFTVLEIDYVHPFDRPGRGSYVEFGFAPAF